ncbi:hypothetical protein F0U59_11460 [Archangium gephyra]|nr:hypothetical protein F0U59_11460 [Archangium gephyra]
MKFPLKSLSSLTALGLLMTAPACTGADAPEAPDAVASVTQAATIAAIAIDGDTSTYENLQVLIGGRISSMDEVARILGTQSLTSGDIFATTDGQEIRVEGAIGTLTAQGESIDGFKAISDSALNPVGVRSVFYAGQTLIELRFTVLPTSDPQMNEALAQVSQMNALIQDLAKRYPNIEKENPDTFAQKEAAQLEKIATLYCLASGEKPGCAPNTSAEGGGDPKSKLALSNWWNWVITYLLDFSKVGVIPNATSCPSSYPLVQIYHDDEDKKNANSRSGWLGGITSNNNTLFRFCKVDGRNFMPLTYSGSQYNYTVLNLSGICPLRTTRYMVRHFDNEDSANANWGSGPTFPNVNVLGRNWVMSFCAFSAGAGSVKMTGFANYGFSYGVFAPSNMPGPISLGGGALYKDDQDGLNINFWVGGSDNTMNGGSNTWMGLARVK